MSIPFIKTESNYDFIKRHFQVFVPNRRNAERVVHSGEMELDDTWHIALPRTHCELQARAAHDLQEYLRISQMLTLSVVEVADGLEIAPPCTILFREMPELRHGYVITITPDAITVSAGPMEHLAAAVRLEDRMNFASAPILKVGTETRERLVEVMEVHSACGDDEYPDEELNAIAHAGYNCIVEFMTAPDRNRHGSYDLPALIQRAAKYGLYVTAYSYLSCWIHPDAPNAQATFDAVFGEFARHNRGLHRIKLVGESLEFPSRDPHTTGKHNYESFTDGIPDPRPSPGWYPCYDYPAYLARIERAIHKFAPDVDIVMSTYNWGYLPAKTRRTFVENLPPGIHLELVYDIFGKRTLGDLKVPLMDYSYANAHPSEFFVTEGANAAGVGHPAHYANVNTTGNSWDVGCVPYMPVPHRLLARFNHLETARRKWGLNEHYCCHHQGWSDSFATDFAKELGWSPRLDSEEEQECLLMRIAERDYGVSASQNVMGAWQHWSDAMEHYIGSNEDQYGPWRVGPAYPFIFQPDISRTFSPKEIQFPTAPKAHNGWRIIKTFYHPFENSEQSPGFLRYPIEIKELEKMRQEWLAGLSILNEYEGTPRESFHADNLARLYSLGHFILHTITTTIHIKKWWLLNMQLQTSRDRESALAVLNQIEELAYSEIENARAVIPDVECDSRLGWEPSMEYVADRWHIEWKIRQVESAIREIAIYRDIIQL
ncbi:MAG: hypothetical protein IKO65_09775 [Victivallales bacterium]|nr:hypothetical protein [Victivallales bacterium]